METIITKAVCLNSIDYLDTSKLVTLFSLDLGVISASIKSVKKQTAKMKMACQNFCFCEYSLINVNGKYQIINFSLIDSFFALTKDLKNFYLGNILLEVTQKSLEKNMPNSQVFINLIKCLKSICYENKNAEYVVGHYIAFMLNTLGYKLNFSNCAVCNEKLNDNIYFEEDRGCFVCYKCASPFVKKVDYDFMLEIYAVYVTPLSQSDTLDFEKINTFKVLKFLAQDLQQKIELPMNSLTNYEEFINFFRS